MISEAIMKRLFAVTFGFGAMLMAQQGEAPATSSQTLLLPQTEVESAVQQFEAAFAAGYNSGDAKQVADLYTETGTLLTESGITLSGRERIEKALAAGFAQHKDAKLENTPQNSVAVSRDVIVTQGLSRLTPADNTQQPSEFLYTRVLTRQQDKWRIAVAQYARSNPWVVTLPTTPVGHTSPPKRVSLTNTGPTALRIRNMSLSGRAVSDFTKIGMCARPVPQGGSCVLTFTFRPASTGPRKASLWFNDDAGTGPHELRLIGTGK